MVYSSGESSNSKSLLVVGACAVGISAFSIIKTKFFPPPDANSINSKLKADRENRRGGSHSGNAGGGSGGSHHQGSGHEGGGPGAQFRKSGHATTSVFFEQKPEAKLAARHIHQTDHTRSEWRDDRLGVRLRYHSKAVEIEGETRIYPVIRLNLKLREFKEYSVRFTIEDVVQPMSAREYRNACVDSLAELPKIRILSESDLHVQKNLYYPQLYYAQEVHLDGGGTNAGGNALSPSASMRAPSSIPSHRQPPPNVMTSSAATAATGGAGHQFSTPPTTPSTGPVKTSFITSVFMARGNICVALELESERDTHGKLPDPFFELIRAFTFTNPVPSGSYLQITEPRMGLGFQLPVGFTLLSDDVDSRFKSSGGSGTSGSLPDHLYGAENKANVRQMPESTSSSVFANLQDTTEDLHFVGRFETITSTHHSLTQIAKSSLENATTFFQVDIPKSTFTSSPYHGARTPPATSAGGSSTFNSLTSFGGSSSTTSSSSSHQQQQGFFISDWNGATHPDSKRAITLRGKVASVQGSSYDFPNTLQSCLSADFDKLDDAQTFEEERAASSLHRSGGAFSSSGGVPPHHDGDQQQQQTTAPRQRQVLVCCFVVGASEVVSLCLAGPAESSLTERTFLKLLDSLSFGNSYGQDTSVALICQHSMAPFRLQIGTGLAFSEPVIGDPALFCRCPELEMKCSLMIRHFPCKQSIAEDPDAWEAFVQEMVLTSCVGSGCRAEITAQDRFDFVPGSAGSNRQQEPGGSSLGSPHLASGSGGGSSNSANVLYGVRLEHRLVEDFASGVSDAADPAQQQQQGGGAQSPHPRLPSNGGSMSNTAPTHSSERDATKSPSGSHHHHHHHHPLQGNIQGDMVDAPIPPTQAIFMPYPPQDEHIDPGYSLVYLTYVVTDGKENGFVIQICTIEYFLDQAYVLFDNMPSTFKLL